MTVVGSATQHSASGEITAEGYRRYNVTYIVETNSRSDGPQVALTASGLPKQNDRYAIGNDSDTATRCQSLNASLLSESDSGKLWRITASYTNEGPSGSGWGSVITTWSYPWDKFADWSFGTVSYQVMAKNQATGKYLKNSLGDPFDPAPQIDSSGLAIRMSRSVLESTLVTGSTNLPNLFFLRLDYVNSATFWGFAAKELRITSINAQKKWWDFTPYWDLTYEVMAAPGPDHSWNMTLLNAGYREGYTDGAAVKVKDITTDKLNLTNGGPYPISTTSPFAAISQDDVRAGSEEYTAFQVYDTTDFSTMPGLITTFGAPF